MRVPPTLFPAIVGAEADASLQPMLRVTIVSHVRFLRESLAGILGQDPGIDVLGHYATLGDALRQTPKAGVNIFLLDAAITGGIGTVARLRAAAPGRGSSCSQ